MVSLDSVLAHALDIPMITFFYRCYMLLGHLVGRLAGALTLLLVLVTVYDVLLRYFFQSGSIAVQELEWHLFAAIILLGAGYTLRMDEHVRVDLLYSRLGTRGKAAVDLFGTIVFLLPFCVLGVYVSVPFVQRAYELTEKSPDPGGLTHRYLVKALIPIGFVLIALEGLRLLLRNICLLYYGASYTEWGDPKGRSG